MLDQPGTKQAIFDAAVCLFAREHYHNVSIREIAQEVGIKPSSIYNHYPSKEAILLAIYNYFDTTQQRLMPDLPQLMLRAETEHPHNILRSTVVIYPQEVRDPISKAMRITASMVHSDPRAEAVVRKNLIEMSFVYDIPLLNRMLELERIEPIDVEGFALLHSAFGHSVATRFYRNENLSEEVWLRGMELLISRVVPRQPPGSQPGCA